MDKLESFKAKTKKLLKEKIKYYQSLVGYEDYAGYSASLLEDIYHDIFGIWPWEESNGN